MFGLLASVMIFSLFACATKPQVMSMQTSGGQQQQVTVPESIWTGTASGEQANVLAKGIVDTNNNSMKEADKSQGRFDKVDKNIADLQSDLKSSTAKLQSTEDSTLQTAQQALAKIEKISNERGTGEITLFFKTGSTSLSRIQEQRLINFLDFLSRTNYGRKIIFMSIGSASATGSKEVDMKLSVERSKAPMFTIEQYLVNVPHTFSKVVGLGDKDAPKKQSKEIDQRYQSVRIIAVYDESALPK